jgi:hypothetical protein
MTLAIDIENSLVAFAGPVWPWQMTSIGTTSVGVATTETSSRGISAEVAVAADRGEAVAAHRCGEWVAEVGVGPGTRPQS